MQIVVKGDTGQISVFNGKALPAGVVVCIAGKDPLPETADAWFDLGYETEGAAFPAITNMPVFVNAVVATQAELAPNQIRFNGWNGFLERPLLEIAQADTPFIKKALNVLDQLGWSYNLVPDVPGMVSARVVSMIVNEAYFALGEGVSTRDEIDTAMQLGTNYPHGPFAWAALIGQHRILSLLNRLSLQDARYTPAAALISETEKHNSQ